MRLGAGGGGMAANKRRSRCRGGSCGHAAEMHNRTVELPLYVETSRGDLRWRRARSARRTGAAVGVDSEVWR